MRPYEPYTPQTPGEVIDQLGSMMLRAPKFIDRTGYLPLTIDTEFRSLNGGLDTIRRKLGEDRYQELRGMSDQMRALFERDPDDTNGGCDEGRELIDQMQQMLRRRKAANDRA